MKHLVNYKLFENTDVEDMSEDEKIQLIEDNIDAVKEADEDGIISDNVYSKIKKGLTKTLAAATIAALALMTMQSCATNGPCIANRHYQDYGNNWQKYRPEPGRPRSW